MAQYFITHVLLTQSNGQDWAGTQALLVQVWRMLPLQLDAPDTQTEVLAWVVVVLVLVWHLQEESQYLPAPQSARQALPYTQAPEEQVAYADELFGLVMVGEREVQGLLGTAGLGAGRA